ncbi:hypothetical protein FB45DRAFT_875975 [Roridomyces roridus]|uniref:Zn(2)-C6 fungal-type domain-containing protein n=1 Tax=Roridomyces roridus TaxID=1738132 RepID=A0AAD7B4D2_9AGAR|nr:hypothetical protein FB45DRAFT_875975 [Roridomyces roridus]
MSSTAPSSSGSPKLRRTILACTHCRKRKVRCITTEQPPTNPCTRCKTKKLSCQYVSADVAVGTREHSPTSPTHSPNSDPGDLFATVSTAEGWAHIHDRRARTPGPGALSLPGSSFHDQRRSSPSSPTVVSPQARRYPVPQRPLSTLYDTQAIYSPQYPDARHAGSAAQSHPPMPPGRPIENYFVQEAIYVPDPAQLQNDMDLWTNEHEGGHPWSNNPGSGYESGRSTTTAGIDTAAALMPFKIDDVILIQTKTFGDTEQSKYIPRLSSSLEGTHLPRDACWQLERERGSIAVGFPIQTIKGAITNATAVELQGPACPKPTLIPLARCVVQLRVVLELVAVAAPPELHSCHTGKGKKNPWQKIEQNVWVSTAILAVQKLLSKFSGAELLGFSPTELEAETASFNRAYCAT